MQVIGRELVSSHRTFSSVISGWKSQSLNKTRAYDRILKVSRTIADLGGYLRLNQLTFLQQFFLSLE